MLDSWSAKQSRAGTRPKGAAARHQYGETVVKTNEVTFEAGIPAEHEVFFISDSTEFRAAAGVKVSQRDRLFADDDGIVISGRRI